MDPTKQPLAVVSMAYKDYFFLKRWHSYYSNQAGADNLYLMSHGNDPLHRSIATGANVLNLPRDPTMHKFDRRRWRAMARFASGLLDFYNWVIVADIDEIVIVDPLVAPSLIDHLQQHPFSAADGPKNIAPLCLELIHTPAEEPLPITEGETILSRRRIFRPNRNYSKPCLVGAPMTYGPGGHRNDLGRRHLPDHLYTLHLKYFDHAIMASTAAARRALIKAADVASGKAETAHSWNRTLEAYGEIVASSTLTKEDIALPEFRAAMLQQIEKYTDQFIWGPVRTDKLYRIPERFSSVF